MREKLEMIGATTLRIAQEATFGRSAEHTVTPSPKCTDVQLSSFLLYLSYTHMCMRMLAC